VRSQLESLLSAALDSLAAAGVVPSGSVAALEPTRQKDHGDFTTNVALVLAKAARRPPRELAQAIVDALPRSPLIARVEIAGPGFINLHLAAGARFSVIAGARAAGESYGRSALGAGRRVLLEFVSANPTGPLHVGHGRGAAYGDALARLLRAAGYAVDAEYYNNDAGRQMDILAASVWLRYLELCGETIAFPENAYQGDYVWDIASSLRREDGERHRRSGVEALADTEGAQPEVRLDTLIANARRLLGADYRRVFDAGLTALTGDIRGDLHQFGVDYANWFSERSLHESGAVAETIEELKRAGRLYEKDGAWWFRSTAYGDEKDRVVVRENGAPTYLAADIAYHRDKFRRGYAQLVNIWGADHHGYIARVQGAVQALGLDVQRLTVLLVQFAVLWRGGEKVSMSTRSGEYVTLRELRQEIGNDAARFFYVLRKSEQHMDFDLDLARSQSNDNPVYYVQYAHARISSVFRQAADKGIATDDLDGAELALLREPHEEDLVALLARYPRVLEAAARSFEPHQIAYFLRELAQGLHTYYNAHGILGAEPELRRARLALVDAVRVVLRNGLEMLGVGAPERM
jgi:arginyl-tRNA synthetase